MLRIEAEPHAVEQDGGLAVHEDTRCRDYPLRLDARLWDKADDERTSCDWIHVRDRDDGLTSYRDLRVGGYLRDLSAVGADDGRADVHDESRQWSITLPDVYSRR